MGKGFNLIALNADYEIVALLSYTNLQWNRKYYEPGSFSVEIPLSLYDPSYCYIYTKDRQELGVIGQINYSTQGDFQAVNLSGYFLENELNHHIVHRKGTGNISNGPEWVNCEGAAEDVAHAFFEGFKSLSFDDNGTAKESILDIEAAESLARGKTANHERCGEQLGDKIYHILKASEMSYRVEYDFQTSKKVFSVWGGYDRTQDQNENNPVTFSTRYGNIKNPDILIDNVLYRNACIVENQNNTTTYSRAMSESEDGEKMKFCFVRSFLNRSDYSNDSTFYTAMKSEGHTSLLDRTKTINVEFDAIEGSYEYMTDFDLGDKCNIEIPEMAISANAVLIGCYEVIKKGIWNLTLEFGTPILRNRR